MSEDDECPACFGTGFEPRMQPAHPGEAGVPIKPQPRCPECGGTRRRTSKFYIGDGNVQRSREVPDDQKPCSISGLPIEGGFPKLFTGIAQAIDPNPLSPAPGREWRITLRETKPRLPS
jgi:hypothetical protein